MKIIFSVPVEDLFKMGEEQSPFHFINDMPSFSNVMNAYAFENANVQKLIHSTDLHFDVIINEEFFADSFLMFAHKYNAPTITLCPFGISNHVDQQQGLMTPWSIAPFWVVFFNFFLIGSKVMILLRFFS